jgi:hypothetical protein
VTDRTWSRWLEFAQLTAVLRTRNFGYPAGPRLLLNVLYQLGHPPMTGMPRTNPGVIQLLTAAHSKAKQPSGVPQVQAAWLANVEAAHAHQSERCNATLYHQEHSAIF